MQEERVCVVGVGEWGMGEWAEQTRNSVRLAQWGLPRKQPSKASKG